MYFSSLVIIVSLCLAFTTVEIQSKDHHRRHRHHHRNSTRVDNPPGPVGGNNDDELGNMARGNWANTRIDSNDFRGAAGRQARSAGYMVNNGGNAGTTALLMQMMAQQNSAKACNVTGGSPPMDFNMILPVLLQTMQQPTMVGGGSG